MAAAVSSSPLLFLNFRSLSQSLQRGLLFPTPTSRISAAATRVPASKSNPFSSASYSTAAAVADIETGGRNPVEDPTEVERVVLPTNDSSDNLLRIRHTGWWDYWPTSDMDRGDDW